MPILFLWSVPLALVWMLLTNRWTWQSALVGYVFGLVILMVVISNVRQQGISVQRVSLRTLPRQMWTFMLYVTKLFLDILSSGIDVALRILPAQMRIAPAFRRVPVQDPSHSTVIAALSAHAITITPGSLVVDYETDDDGQQVMIVHVLDGETWTEDSLCEEQARRVERLRGILGRE